MKLSLATLRNTSLAIHIVGAAAVEGSSIARLLYSLGATNVTLHDFCEAREFNKRFLTFHNGVEDRTTLLKEMQKLPYMRHFKETYLEGVRDADLLFVPQHWYGYDANFPVLDQVLRDGKVAVSSLIDLSLQLFPGRTIGITGTHGKTTVTRLLTHILFQANKQVFTAGNDRHSTQFLSKIHDLDHIRSDRFLVLEISNRQLKLPLEKSPNLAIVTNIYPNHLDEHESLDEYRLTKQKIAAAQSEHDQLIVGGENEALKDWAMQRGGVAVDENMITVFNHNFVMPDTLQGEHNVANAALVYEACRFCGITDAEFNMGLSTFPGVEKRQQVVWESTKVKVVNNAIATTPTATLAAMKTFATGPLFLIVGGDDKNIPQATWDLLKHEIAQRTDVQVAALPGSISNKLYDSSWLQVETIEQALESACAFVEQQKSPTTVLISPSGEAFYTMYLVGKSLTTLAEAYFSSSTTLNRG